ncbi:ABC transporter permease [Blattabacterium cuenoti]|uniref:Lipoprotein releasing system transmembrane protein n=1 Tax=Blattabacterium cuenoti STAT TaxID=1457030 RepID=A0A224AL62_9FLAO|nr:FtsX-like permease family protein [Blattabacterium cuenoti]BBA17390.1 lipoprotein releasing system transmembrane protein [Blattabacterium cuenoti STAT]
MNFEWFFSKKTIWEDCRKNKTLRTIVIITQITIIFGLIVSFFTFSIGFGFKKIIKDKLLNVRGQFLISQKYNLNTNSPFFSVKKKKFLLKKFFNSDLVKQIHGISEKNVIISTNKKIDRFIFKGLYEDYNPYFFQYFLITKKIFPEKLLHNQNVFLSKKASLSLGLNVGSIIKINFLSFDKIGNSIFFYKKFRISGLYETGIPEFDDVYIIGNIKSIQNIYKWKKDSVEKFEVFVSYENIGKNIIKKKSKEFLVQNIQNNHDIIKWINIFDKNIIIISMIITTSLIINMIVFVLILLLERIRTIGILKILGAKNQVIHKIFLFYIMQILIPSLFIGNSIGIIFLILQKKIHLISLNKTQYFIDFVPIYIKYYHIIIINLSIIFICFVTIFFPSLFFIKKILSIKVTEFE